METQAVAPPSSSTPRPAATPRMRVGRVFSSEGVDPYDQLQWSTRDVSILESDGRVIFAQSGVEAPASWSDLAVRVVASKYFYGPVSAGNGDPAEGKREWSVRQLVGRVAKTIADWGDADGYFETRADSDRFADELAWLCLNQHGAFNSPVWFNVGVNPNRVGYCWDANFGRAVPVADVPGARYQSSACFILPVGDTIPEIAARATSEMLVFKDGSGAGSDNSRMRSCREPISGGGMASGPVSFMRVYDAVAAVTKSGGINRRAAKMEILRADHPDIREFIACKVGEERKARALIAEGYDSSFNGDAYGSVQFQNSNLSIRVDDRFMAKVARDDPDDAWQTIAVATGDRLNAAGTPMPEYSASALMDEIASAAWECGDPGMQYDGAIQAWHTCPNSGRIWATNPCCFTGETLVRTSEGKLPIALLADMDRLGLPLPLAFSFDFRSGLPVLRQINRAWKAGDAADLVEVATDKGIVVRCTPEHRFYLRSGEAVRAKDLRPGMRLRKIGRGQMGRMPRTSIETKDATCYQSRWMWEQIHGPIPDGREVHHRNGDRWDDRLSNFELVAAGTHQRMHSGGTSNPRFIRCDDRVLVEVWEACEATPRKTWKSHVGVSPSQWNSYVKANGLAGKVPVAQPGRQGRIQGKTWAEFAEWIEARRPLVNDVVLGVRPIAPESPTPVYDIEVEGTHNFEIGTTDSRHGIIVSNSEYVFLDDTACNLASLNLMKFRSEAGVFDVDRFRAACRIFIIAQDILLDRSSYPTAPLAANSHHYRTLGLGYANLGALLMSLGHAYDSDEGRSLAGAITALMGAAAYGASAEMAGTKGPFAGFAANREPMNAVIRRHTSAAYKASLFPPAGTRAIWQAANDAWDIAVARGEDSGFRNAQVTVLAPTGTIAFMMDCDTTGIEPAIGLVTYKTLAGGGSLKLVNQTVPIALRTLGYGTVVDSVCNGDISRVDQVASLVEHIEKTGTIEGPYGPFRTELNPDHLPVFDCAFPAREGGRSIHWRGHLKMMAAIQPFLSGASSKTINMPRESTVDDIREAYLEGWRLGLKAVAIYRDGSKESQPVTTSEKSSPSKASGPIPMNADGASDMDRFRSTVGWTDGEVMADRGTFGQIARLLNFQVGLGDPPGSGEGAVECLKRLIAERGAPRRERLPDTRRSLTHKFALGGAEFYMTVGLFPDDRPGELFIQAAREGSTVSGLMDGWATMISVALQYGVPLAALTAKFRGGRFEPSGMSSNPSIRFATSPLDYVAQWMEMTFGGTSTVPESPPSDPPGSPLPPADSPPLDPIDSDRDRRNEPLISHAKMCATCGGFMIPNGACWCCVNCGSTDGGCGG